MKKRLFVGRRLSCFCGGFGGHGCFLFREIHGVDGAGGALGHALAAGLALGEVDVGEVVGDGDGLEGAGFGALAAADTGGFAVFAGHGALLLVIAGHEHAAVVLALVADFEHAARACSGASLAAHAEVFVHLGQMGFRVDVDGIELAGIHAVAAAQACERAGALARIQRVGEGARDGGVVIDLCRGVLARAVAAHHTYLRLAGLGLDSQDLPDLVVVAAGAVGHVEVVFTIASAMARQPAKPQPPQFAPGRQACTSSMRGSSSTWKTFDTKNRMMAAIMPIRPIVNAA